MVLVQGDVGGGGELGQEFGVEGVALGDGFRGGHDGDLPEGVDLVPEGGPVGGFVLEDRLGEEGEDPGGVGVRVVGHRVDLFP